jgi:twitching motility protein PilI
MANREAIRELHSRLATRLQAARSGEASASWLAVEIAGKKYLLPLSQAGEIFPWTPTQAVPHSQHWFSGVTNLRGGLFCVVDMAAYLSKTRRAAMSDSARAEMRLVTFNPALDINCGLLVDRLLGLRNLDAFISSASPQATEHEFLGEIYATVDGVAWQELNLQVLSQQAQFLSISA